MKKVLILCGLLITVITAFAAVSFAQRPMNYDRTMNSDPTYNQTMAAMNDLVRSINALGGSIKVEDGKVSIKLSFTEKQERMLEEAIANKDSMRYERAMANGDMGDMSMTYRESNMNMGYREGNMNTGYRDGYMPPVTSEEYCRERADYYNHFLHCGIPRDQMEAYGITNPDWKLRDSDTQMQDNYSYTQGQCPYMNENCPYMQGNGNMMGMGQMMPMNMQVEGKCPHCGEVMNFTVKCGMMNEMGHMGKNSKWANKQGMDDSDRPCRTRGQQ